VAQTGLNGCAARSGDALHSVVQMAHYFDRIIFA
jgi:hypothetical protein